MVVDDPERPRGILSKADREYLLGDKSGYSRQAQHKREKAIRERFENAILDFSILWEHWDESEREEAFPADTVGNEFGDALADLFALVYSETFLGSRMKNLLLRGVSRAERELADDNEYRVTIDFEVKPVERADIPAAIEKFDDWDIGDLTHAEGQVLLHLLRESESITPEDLRGALEEIEERASALAKSQSEARAARGESAREKQFDR